MAAVAAAVGVEPGAVLTAAARRRASNAEAGTSSKAGSRGFVPPPHRLSRFASQGGGYVQGSRTVQPPLATLLASLDRQQLLTREEEARLVIQLQAGQRLLDVGVTLEEALSRGPTAEEVAAAAKCPGGAQEVVRRLQTADAARWDSTSWGRGA